MSCLATVLSSFFVLKLDIFTRNTKSWRDVSLSRPPKGFEAFGMIKISTQLLWRDDIRRPVGRNSFTTGFDFTLKIMHVIFLQSNFSFFQTIIMIIIGVFTPGNIRHCQCLAISIKPRQQSSTPFVQESMNLCGYLCYFLPRSDQHRPTLYSLKFITVVAESRPKLWFGHDCCKCKNIPCWLMLTRLSCPESMCILMFLNQDYNIFKNVLKCY